MKNENVIDSIISNNLSAFASKRITREKAIKNIKSLFTESNTPNCPFKEYEKCSIVNDDNTTPCEKCRVSYEYELDRNDH